MAAKVILLNYVGNM